MPTLPIDDIVSRLDEIKALIEQAPPPLPSPLPACACAAAEMRDHMSETNAALEGIKTAHRDITNKMAFSNDTMLDGIKSITDILLRKKSVQ